MGARLERLQAGMAIPYGGDRLAFVGPELAERFQPGDRLIVVQTTGDLLHVPADAHATASAAVSRARRAFGDMAGAPEAAVSAFFEAFARRLEAPGVWDEVAAANTLDVESAKARGASVTRLVASPQMRQDMIAGLRAWRDADDGRGRVLERNDHEGWSVELTAEPLGVVGFVFEGRPNVFADAAGVIRGGNAVVFRIGSDALRTAQALAAGALAPALREAGLPQDAAVLIDEPAHAAGWALFADPGLALAVARGSGRAVAQLGAIARQSGTPVSLHGTGGAWLIADRSADADRFEAAVEASLDRKVCNTLNVCCIVQARAADLMPRFLRALRAAGERRGRGVKLHTVDGADQWLPADWRNARTRVSRADGEHDEALVEPLALADLGVEWEWEESPEVSLVVADDVDAAIDLFNRLSPRFSVSVIADDDATKARAYDRLDAAFVGDGFTRWVDGQYALGKPELGLSNWQEGRLFARGGVLSGDGVFSVKTRMRQAVVGLRRT